LNIQRRLSQPGQRAPRSGKAPPAPAEARPPWRKGTTVAKVQRPPPLARIRLRPASLSQAILAFCARDHGGKTPAVIVGGLGFMDAAMVLGGRRKSVGVAYFLLAVFGLFGLHRLYLGRGFSAAGMAIITLVSIPLIWSGLGLLGFVTTGTWALADALLIPGMARETNEDDGLLATP